MDDPGNGAICATATHLQHQGRFQIETAGGELATGGGLQGQRFAGKA